MNTINMPGFTAEAALSRTNGHYHLVANPDQSDRGIHPAFDRTFTPARCRARFEFYPEYYGYNPYTGEQWYTPAYGIYLGFSCD